MKHHQIMDVSQHNVISKRPCTGKMSVERIKATAIQGLLTRKPESKVEVRCRREYLESEREGAGMTEEDERGMLLT